MKDAVTRMLNENAFAIATVLGYDATSIGFLNSAPAMIVPDESNEYSKHFYSVWGRGVHVSDEEIIDPQARTLQLPQLDHPCILFFDEALTFLPLGGIALGHRFGC